MTDILIDYHFNGIARFFGGAILEQELRQFVLGISFALKPRRPVSNLRALNIAANRKDGVPEAPFGNDATA